MKPVSSTPRFWSLFFSLAITLAGSWSRAAEGSSPAPKNWSATQDHKNMMEQLGITKLRPGPSGQPNATNSANYEQAKANPFPNLPDPLTLKNGKKVTTPEMWWKQRRPEIVE